MSNVPGVIDASDGPRVRRSMAQHSTRHDKRYKLLKPIWLMATVMTNLMMDYKSSRIFTKPGMADSTQHVEQHFHVLYFPSDQSRGEKCTMVYITMMVFIIGLICKCYGNT